MLEQHLEWCRRRELRPTYVDEIRRTLTRLERQIQTPLEKATEAQLETWWDSLAVSPGARNAYIAHVSGFFRYLRHQRIREDDPTERLIRPRQHRGLPRPIDDMRLRRALSTAEAPISVWLALACYMGLRAHEIATIHGEDIRGDRLFVRDGKGGRQRIVPVHPLVAKLLVGSPMSGPVFTNANGGTLKANTVSQRSNRFLHGVGIPDTIHSLRHWFGSAVYRESRDLRLTQELMGHASPLTTAGYAAWNSEAAAEVVNKLKLAIPL